MKDKENVYKNELNYIKFLEPQIYSETLKMTTSDGSRFIIKNSEILIELEKLSISESFDYILGENLIRRTDDVKLLYTNEMLQCLYPDGTKISTEISIELLLNNCLYNEIPKYNSSATSVNSIVATRTNNSIYDNLNIVEDVLSNVCNLLTFQSETNYFL